MSALQNDIMAYIASAKMSSKIRVLVEGRDDKAHIHNLTRLFCENAKIKIDMATAIKGDCQSTSRNHRAKIEKIHNITSKSSSYRKLVFLCDRENRGFSIGDQILDEIGGHYVNGALHWTAGHSIENYFINRGLMETGLRYITSSPHKDNAISLFSSCLPSATRAAASLTLASMQLGDVSYPSRLVNWRNISIDREIISIDFNSINDPDSSALSEAYREADMCVCASHLEVCILLCRGHTAMTFLKRVFSACLFSAATAAGDDQAEHYAKAVNNLSEDIISNALSEAWINKVRTGEAAYPEPLIESIKSLLENNTHGTQTLSA